jgi:pimeloyl-ACP methyl ester carboxylesterase
VEPALTAQSGFVEGSPRLHYLEWNRRGEPTWLLLHGGTANGWWWEALVRELEQGPRLIALDQRGHGDSEWAPPAYSPEDYAADLRRVTGALGLERPILIGHSQGGINAIAFASINPGAPRATAFCAGCGCCRRSSIPIWRRPRRAFD